MRIWYSNGEIPDKSSFLVTPSIFLAGPTPRSKNHKSWRPQALEYLSHYDFPGDVFVPEWDDGSSMSDYQDQVEWEDRHLCGCTVILFWIPRQLPDFPALTTNVEFGRFVGVKPTVYGRPDWSEKNKYLDWLFEKKEGKKPLTSLPDTVFEAAKLATRIKGVLL